MGETSFTVRVIRAARLGLHILGGVVRAAVLLPWLTADGRSRQVRRWSARLLAILGVRLRATGEVPGMAAGGLMLLANHTSWLDICALNAVCPGRFIAKSEVRGWPVFGWLARKVSTCFIRRGNLRDLWSARAMAREALRKGGRVMVFPEGTTTDGRGVLAFRTGLVQAAVDACAGVVPVMLRYDHEERESPAVFVGDMTFLQSLGRILRSPGFSVEARFLEKLDAGRSDRRRLCATARRMIMEELETAGRRRAWSVDAAMDGLADEGLLELQDTWPVVRA